MTLNTKVRAIVYSVTLIYQAFSYKMFLSAEICYFIDIIRTFAGVTMDPITSLECGAAPLLWVRLAT